MTNAEASTTTMESETEPQSPRPMLPIERGHPDYSALQVVNVEYEKLPSLQVVPDDTKEAVIDDDKYHDPDGSESPSSDAAKQVVISPEGPLPEVVEDSEPKSIPWYRNWRSKRFKGAVALSLVVIVAVVVGAVVGTSEARSSQSAAESSVRISACNNTVCPQILSAAVLVNTTSEDKKLFVFARGNGAIYFNWAQVADLSSTSGWPSESKWSALVGGGAQFISQPSAMAWNLGDRVSVAAVTDKTKMVQMTSFKLDPNGPNNFTVDGWQDLGGPVDSPLATCAINGTRGDFYAVGGRIFLHNMSHRNGTVDMWKHPQQMGNATWDGGDDLGFNQTAKPGVVCRQSEWVHDLVFYDEEGAVRHGMWAWKVPGDHWTPYVNLGGKFKGDPTVIAAGADRVDFFGVGEDKSMYHWTWTEAGNHTKLENLGGSFHSTASAMATGLSSPAEAAPEDVRIDVVALGTNDHVFHRVLRGTTWVSDWEDLGIEGNSAPTLVHYGDSSEGPERVGVFVVGYDNQVHQATWEVTDEPSWKDLKWTSMGGAMTTDYYRWT
ncbi:hypothetical protein V8F20_008814 [Naviculisporaceae sp. PSN 640]